MRGLTPSESGKSPPPQGGGDPWAAFGYVVAGVALYGLLGWGLSVWLHASYLLPIGILVGAALGLVLVFYQYRANPQDGPNDKPDDNQHDSRGEPE
jgi:hypothetical protein